VPSSEQSVKFLQRNEAIIARIATNPQARTALSLAWDYVLLFIGAAVNSIAVVVFQAPFEIAPGGVSGVGVILNALFGTPIGLVILLGNIPIQLLAVRMLDGWRTIWRTAFAIVVYSVLIDVLTPVLTEPLSQDRLLNAIFGGIIGGIGGGLSVIRTGVIITDRPQAVADTLLSELKRGVTGWEARGMFTGDTHSVLYVTIGRSQVNALRRLVRTADPQAFIVIGNAHTAYGRGFRDRPDNDQLP
jgi:uncharacterized membrane-anchored protein YitT (DUF2179 family)